MWPFTRHSSDSEGRKACVGPSREKPLTYAEVTARAPSQSASEADKPDEGAPPADEPAYVVQTALGEAPPPRVLVCAARMSSGQTVLPYTSQVDDRACTVVC